MRGGIAVVLVAAAFGWDAGRAARAGEAGGWIAGRHFESRSDRRRSEAVTYLGDPSDTSAAWSFGRWERSTGGDPSEIRALFDGDREEFYARIARDPTYAAGWAVRKIPPRDEFRNFLDRADGMLARKRYATTELRSEERRVGKECRS